MEHPHVCGEKNSSFLPDGAVDGTPPRVWGKAINKGVSARGGGNTPTCVGKRFRDELHALSVPEHPHVCGEKSSCQRGQFVQVGTPPRVWGKD